MIWVGKCLDETLHCDYVISIYGGWQWNQNNQSVELGPATKIQIHWYRCRFHLPSATKTSSNCSASVTLVHLIRMRAGSVFSGSWWNLQGRVMEPPRCVTTFPGAVCTITAPVSSSVGRKRRRKAGLSKCWIWGMICHPAGLLSRYSVFMLSFHCHI